MLLATHQGLFRLQDGELTQVGPVVDFMGFTLTPEGRYLASGHPAPNTDLPEPLGLAESTDRGQSWTVLSRGGQSDFHALAAGPNGVLGFDGQLRASTDGLTWQSLEIPVAPASLAISPPNRDRAGHHRNRHVALDRPRRDLDHPGHPADAPGRLGR